MKNREQIAIATLSVTASVLFCTMLLLMRLPPAQASSMVDRSGDYIMLTWQLSTSTEGITLVDSASKQVVLYGFDFNAKKLRVIDRFSLDQLRVPNRDQNQGSGRRR
jgi:hypothetical protein